MKHLTHNYRTDKQANERLMEAPDGVLHNW